MTIEIFNVSETDASQRIDKYLTELNPDLSRAQLQTWIKEGYIMVNDQTIKPNYKVQVNDEIKVIPKEPEELDVVAEDIPLSIVYEDSDVVVVNKPKGMVVHPSYGHPSGTLVNALLHHVKDLSGIHDVVRPGIVHRIDRDTSGLLMVAKNDHAHQSLAKQLKDKTVKRSYIALVHGDLPHEYGTIDAPIGRDQKDRQRMTVVTGGKDAITHFEVLERISQKYTLVKCVLETGRTHQIRVHMRYIGFPLVGDPKYGQRKTLKMNGQALHAQELGFNHPRTGEWLLFKADLPEEFEDALKNIRE